MKKKILVLTLVLTMCLGSTMTANAAMPILTGPDSETHGDRRGDRHSLIRQPEQTEQKGLPSYKFRYTEEGWEVLKNLFDPEFYAQTYPDVVMVLGNDEETLWNHYITYGIREGRSVNKDFNVFAYSAAYPDLQEAFGDDLLSYCVHYATFGKNENRQITTLEKAANAGITVTGMNGQIIEKPVPIVPKVSVINNINNNTSLDLSSFTQATVGNISTPSSTEGTECRHDYVTDHTSVTEGWHRVVKRCLKCGNLIEGEPEDHIYSELKDYGDGRHGRICTVCNAWDSSSMGDHEMVWQQVSGERSHVLMCKECGWTNEKSKEACSKEAVFDGDYHWQECTRCKAVIGEKTEHDYKFAILDSDSSNHQVRCSGCNLDVKEQHHFSEGICSCGLVCSHQYENGVCQICGSGH